MSIRTNPKPPFNAAETAFIEKERAAFRERIAHDVRAQGFYFSLGAAGQRALQHQLMVARAVKAGGGNLLFRKLRRAIGWELRFPSSVWVVEHDPDVDVPADKFHATVVPDAGKWGRRLVPGMDMGSPVPDDSEILKWLGIGTGFIGYAGASDPHWSEPSVAERLGDAAAAYADADMSGWSDTSRAETAARFYTGMVGAGWWLSGGDDRTLGDERSNGEWIAWVLEGLEAWPDPQAFYDSSALGMFTTLRARQLAHMTEAGAESGAIAAVTEAMWVDFTATQYAAALAEGRKLT